MRKKLRISIVLLGMVTLTSLFAGCSLFGKKSEPQPELLPEMQENLKKISALNLEWRLELEGGGDTEAWGNTALLVKSSGQAQADPATGKSSALATIYRDSRGQEETMDVEVYTALAGESLETYLLLRDEWLQVSLPKRAEGLLPDWNAWSEVLETEKETVERDGISCYCLRGEVGNEAAAPFAAAWMSCLGYADYDLLCGRSLLVSVYISEEGHELKELSLTLGNDVRNTETTAGEEEESSSETEPAADEGGSETPFAISTFRLALRFDFAQAGIAEVPAEAREHARTLKSLRELVEHWYAEGLAEEDYLGSAVSMLPRLSSPELVREWDAEDVSGLVMEQEGITLRLLRVYTNGRDAAYADLEVENAREKDVLLTISGSALNYEMVENSVDFSVEAGTSSLVCLYFPGTEGWQDPRLISLKMAAYGLADNKTVFETDRLDIPLAGEVPEAALKDGGSLLLDNDLLQVMAYPADSSDEHLTVITLGVLNKSQWDIGVFNNQVSIDGVPVDAYAFGQAFSGCLFYTGFTFVNSALARQGIEEIADICFTLDVQNMKTLNHINTTEELVIP